MKLKPVDEFILYAGESEQSKYMLRYAKRLGCTKIYVEEKYIDKDYIKDFQWFYSRSFEDIPKAVTRIFFFKDDVKSNDLIGCDKTDEEIQKSCIGFVTVKPVKDKHGNFIIGRTVFNHYDRDNRKVFVESEQHAYLAGREMSFKTLPFKCQDAAVGACASTALWIVVNGLKDRFDIPNMSLFEITKMATKYPTFEGRRFPSDGLSSGQMCFFLSELGLEFDLMNMIDKNIVNEYFETIVKAYTAANIPIIAGLMLRGDEGDDHHAVVISGYQTADDGKIIQLYVHDDQIGPYASITSENGFKTWTYRKDYAWSKMYNSIELELLMVPLYHKIRLPFPRVWGFRSDAIKSLGKMPAIRLADSNRYKKELRSRDLDDPSCLERRMPKYIWIFSFKTRDKSADFIFDATSVNPLEICIVFHKEKK